MLQSNSLGPRSRWGLQTALVFVFLLLAPLFAGCSSQGPAQAQPTAATGAGTAIPAIPAVTAGNPTQTPAAASQTPAAELPTVPPQATAELITPTEPVSSTGTVTATEVEPTPTGAPPDPLTQLNIFDFFPPEDTLVKRDVLDLDGTGKNDVLFTVAAPRLAVTTEATSILGVLTYDDIYRRWSLAWNSTPFTGTASPLPAANRAGAGGFNGGNLLGTGKPIIVARTTSLNGKAHLFLWQWNKDAHRGEALKMLPPGSSTEKDAQFDADLDINFVDIDDDGRYEVVADNLTGVQIWKWDGNRFMPQEAR